MPEEAAVIGAEELLGGEVAAETIGAAGAFDAAGSAGLESAFGIGAGADTAGGVLASDAGLGAVGGDTGGFVGGEGGVSGTGATAGTAGEGAVPAATAELAPVTATLPASLPASTGLTTSAAAASGIPDTAFGASSFGGVAMPVGGGGGGDGFVPPEETAPLTNETPFEKTAREAIEAAKQVPPGSSTIAQKIWDQIQKNPLTAGALGLNLASGLAQRRSAGQIPAQLRDVAAPVAGVRDDLLAQYKSGKINPGSEFDINRWQTEQTTAVKNFYAKAGQPDSAAARNAVAQIEAKANAMRDQARQGLLTQGLTAAGMAEGPLTTAVMAQAQQDQQFMQSQASALQSLMLLQALSAGRAPAGAAE